MFLHGLGIMCDSGRTGATDIDRGHEEAPD